jgi:hypothetical protein
VIIPDLLWLNLHNKLERKLSFLIIKVIKLTIKVTILSLKVTTLRLKARTLSLEVTILSIKIKAIAVDYLTSNSLTTKTLNSFTRFKAASLVKKASQLAIKAAATCNASGN